jgi:hypothetical protein
MTLQELQDEKVGIFNPNCVPTDEDQAYDFWTKFDQGLLSACSNEELGLVPDWEAFMMVVYLRCYDKHQEYLKAKI